MMTIIQDILKNNMETILKYNKCFFQKIKKKEKLIFPVSEKNYDYF